MYAPDEISVHIDDVANNDYFIYDYLFKNINNLDLRVFSAKLSEQDKSSEYLLSLPFFDINNKSLRIIPIKLLNLCYGTSDMCAGNTREEAISQEICEILERYVNFQILKLDITPPTIGVEYLAKYKTLSSIISNIEKDGYRVIVKDCSLGQGFPVVGIIVIHIESRRSAVKFGSQIVFEYALERALTELLQGNEINKLSQLVDLNTESQYCKSETNIENIFLNGKGHYPLSFFCEDFSYDFHGVSEVDARNSKDTLSYLYNFVSDLGYDILVRDVSFLGFPSYFIVIPGISEIEGVTLTNVDLYYDFFKSSEIIKQLPSATKKDLAELSNYIDKLGMSVSDPINKLLLIPIKEKSLWTTVTIDFFLSTIYMINEEYEKSSIYMEKFVIDLRERYNKCTTL